MVIVTHPNVWYRNYGFHLVYALKRLLPFLRRASGEKVIKYDPRGERKSGLHVNEQSILSLRKNLNKAGFKSKVWLKPRFAYRRERLAGEFNLPGIFLYYIVHALETWVPFKYIFADQIYAIAYANEG